MSEILDHCSSVVPTNVSEVIPERKKRSRKSSVTITSVSVSTPHIAPDSVSTVSIDSNPYESDLTALVSNTDADDLFTYPTRRSLHLSDYEPIRDTPSQSQVEAHTYPIDPNSLHQDDIAPYDEDPESSGSEETGVDGTGTFC